MYLQFLYALPFAALLLIPPSLLLALVRTQDGWRRGRAPRRSPFSRPLLRSPGQGLRVRLEDVRGERDQYLLCTFIAPPLVFAAHVSQSYFAGAPETPARTAITFLGGLGFTVFAAYKCTRLRSRMRNLQLGLEGETAVGQELEFLRAQGFEVFHDFPAEGFNIDHVMVGPPGVFAVETKARSKPDRGRRGDARVVYNGETLIFPGWTEIAPLEQVKREARWLTDWITRAAGERVVVQPVLALPGWFVDRTGRGEVRVYSGTHRERAFEKGSGDPLTEAQVGRIARQIEQRCRDVEPAAYRRPEPVSTPLTVS